MDTHTGFLAKKRERKIREKKSNKKIGTTHV
jgi:hypothetical protein